MKPALQLWLCGLVAIAPLLLGQERQTPPAHAGVTNQAGPPPPPPLPKPRSPVDMLRQLLALGPAEREAALAARSEKSREYLRLRLQEFDTLSAAEREVRLRLLQLRYHLLPLMRTALADRPAQLDLVPEEDRRLILQRLKEWDALPPEQRKELLENEQTLRYFPRFETNTLAQQELALASYPTDRRQKIEEDLARWREYTDDQRQRMYGQFQRFFELSDGERHKTLDTLPPAQRRRMESAVQAFAHLPADRRDKCLEAFRRFISMSGPELERFLNNAARWESMTPEERRAWRELTAQLPPLPPGMQQLLPPAPMPPPVRPQPAVTNAQVRR